MSYSYSSHPCSSSNQKTFSNSGILTNKKKTIETISSSSNIIQMGRQNEERVSGHHTYENEGGDSSKDSSSSSSDDYDSCCEECKSGKEQIEISLRKNNRTCSFTAPFHAIINVFTKFNAFFVGSSWSHCAQQQFQHLQLSGKNTNKSKANDISYNKCHGKHTYKSSCKNKAGDKYSKDRIGDDSKLYGKLNHHSSEIQAVNSYVDEMICEFAQQAVSPKIRNHKTTKRDSFKGNHQKDVIQKVFCPQHGIHTYSPTSKFLRNQDHVQSQQTKHSFKHYYHEHCRYYHEMNAFQFLWNYVVRFITYLSSAQLLRKRRIEASEKSEKRVIEDNTSTKTSHKLSARNIKTISRKFSSLSEKHINKSLPEGSQVPKPQSAPSLHYSDRDRKSKAYMKKKSMESVIENNYLTRKASKPVSIVEKEKLAKNEDNEDNEYNSQKYNNTETKYETDNEINKNVEDLMSSENSIDETQGHTLKSYMQKSKSEGPKLQKYQKQSLINNSIVNKRIFDSKQSDRLALDDLHKSPKEKAPLVDTDLQNKMKSSSLLSLKPSNATSSVAREQLENDRLSSKSVETNISDFKSTLQHLSPNERQDQQNRDVDNRSAIFLQKSLKEAMNKQKYTINDPKFLENQEEGKVQIPFTIRKPSESFYKTLLEQSGDTFIDSILNDDNFTIDPSLNRPSPESKRAYFVEKPYKRKPTPEKMSWQTLQPDPNKSTNFRTSKTLKFVRKKDFNENKRCVISNTFKHSNANYSDGKLLQISEKSIHQNKENLNATTQSGGSIKFKSFKRKSVIERRTNSSRGEHS